MGWSIQVGKACFDGESTVYSLTEIDVFTVGEYYAVEITVSDITQGKLIIDSLAGKPEITANGTYTFYAKAIQTSLQLRPALVGLNMFIGCIENVQAYEIPLYQIIDSVGNIAFQQVDLTGITQFGDHIQYIIDWTELAAGSYKIKFTDSPIDYESNCFCLTTDTCKNLVLSWENESNAYGFYYPELSFRPMLRLIGRLWKPSYPKDKNTFLDSKGTAYIISSKTRKKETLSIEGIPQYLHDALSVGVEHDHFYVEYGSSIGEFVNEEDDYVPSWSKNNTSSLATIELEVFKKSQNLKNSRCAGTLE